MGNLSCSVSGLGAGDASRKSLRGSTRTFQRRRGSSSCHHFTADNNPLVGVLGDKVVCQDRGQIVKNDVTKTVLSAVALEDLLDDCSCRCPDTQNFELDVSFCVSPFMDDGGSGYFSDGRDQLAMSPREELDVEDDDDDNDALMMMCQEDKAVMFLKSPTTICGEEWINWTVLCPCCRRDASDDSIDLQEMIKLEPIKARTQCITNHYSSFSLLPNM